MGIQKNIWKYYTILTIANSIFFLPIFVVFLKSHNLSFTQIFFLQTIFALSTALFEIPSGFFADVHGRKKALLLGVIIQTAGLITYSTGDVYWHFCLAEVFWGIGFSFISGSDSALLYDTLLELKREKEYSKIEGKAFFYTRVGSLIASITGAFMAAQYLKAPFYFMIPLFILNIIIVSTTKEPHRHKKLFKKDYLKKFKKIAKFSFSHKDIRWLLIYFGVIDGFGTVLFWLVQPYMLALSIDLKFFGLIFGIMQVVTAITAVNAYKLEKTLGKKTSLILLGFSVSIPLIVMGFHISLFAMLLLIFLEFAWAFNIPVVKDYINKIVYSDKRATVLSIGSFFSRMVIAIFSPLAGYLADIDVGLSYVVLGIIALILSSICLYNLKKDKVI